MTKHDKQFGAARKAIEALRSIADGLDEAERKGEIDAFFANVDTLGRVYRKLHKIAEAMLDAGEGEDGDAERN